MVLKKSDLSQNPFDQFKKWLSDAQSHPDIALPNAMCISTIDEEGFPDSRYVLLKHMNEHSIVFYTNITSNKGLHLRASPKIAANFYWAPLRRQVRMKGQVEIIADSLADTYFATRSRGSQLGAWASKQSQILQYRQILEDRLKEFTTRFTGIPVPRPDYWSGYRIIPHQIEFWQNGPERMHDRFLYKKDVLEGWIINRLYP